MQIRIHDLDWSHKVVRNWLLKLHHYFLTFVLLSEHILYCFTLFMNLFKNMLLWCSSFEPWKKFLQCWNYVGTCIRKLFNTGHNEFLAKRCFLFYNTHTQISFKQTMFSSMVLKYNYLDHPNNLKNSLEFFLLIQTVRYIKLL